MTAQGGNERVWLITGGSSGFGRANAEAALSRGDGVAARRPVGQSGWMNWSDGLPRGRTASRST
jgi:NAD(P)-dependent dehydrogenase (short-subunit alcohol dehydrogenase family)